MRISDWSSDVCSSDLKGIAMQRGMQCAVAMVLLGVAAGQGAQAQNFIGAGAAFLPEYDGAKDYRFLPVPLINYENGNFFISPRAGLPATGLQWDLEPEIGREHV